MYSPTVQRSSRLLASVCLLVAVGAGCSVSNGPAETASQSQSRSSCPDFPPVPQGPAVITRGFAYAVNTPLDKVVWYAIGSTGTLTRQGEIEADFQPTFIAAHRTRNLMYVANFCSNKISAYIIGTNGALTPVKGSPFEAGAQPASIAVDSTHDFIYVTNFGADSVSAYKIGADGELALKQTLTTGGGPDAIAVDAKDTFAYVANFKSNTVSAYKIVTTGAGAGTLEATVPKASFDAGSGPNAIAIHPTQPWIYVTNETSNNVWAYSYDTEGNLTELPASPVLPGSPFPSGAGPEGIAVDPSGKLAYVADGLGDTVSTYTIDTATGLLKRDPTTVQSIDDPEGVVVDPTGTFVYTVNRNTRDILAYEITDVVTGVLKFLSKFPL